MCILYMSMCCNSIHNWKWKSISYTEWVNSPGEAAPIFHPITKITISYFMSIYSNQHLVKGCSCALCWGNFLCTNLQGVEIRQTEPMRGSSGRTKRVLPRVLHQCEGLTSLEYPEISFSPPSLTDRPAWCSYVLKRLPFHFTLAGEKHICVYRVRAQDRSLQIRLGSV